MKTTCSVEKSLRGQRVTRRRVPCDARRTSAIVAGRRRRRVAPGQALRPRVGWRDTVAARDTDVRLTMPGPTHPDCGSNRAFDRATPTSLGHPIADRVGERSSQ